VEITKRKVFAYITHAGRLLVFRHVDFPEAGTQVPGGTVEPGETFEAAIHREVEEETGLTGLELVALIGEQVRNMADVGVDETQHQRFYHLRCHDAPPERWQHFEEHASDGSEPLLFEFWWVRLADEVPELAGVQGQFLPELIKQLD
jgi:8-oxo-dGTP diphosphatase